MQFDINNDNDVAIIKAAFKGKVVGLTSGCYDLFHHLHLVYLQRCRRQCDVLIVGVDSNDEISRVKGNDRPLIPEHQRIAIVSELQCVDAAFIMGNYHDFGKAVERLGANRIFKNQDSFNGEAVLGADKAELVIIRDIANHSSTTQIVDMIAKQLKVEKKEQGL
jgi:cytidyltransferase-like protein